MTMSSSQTSGAGAPGGGHLEDAVTAFGDAVFEATQGLLRGCVMVKSINRTVVCFETVTSSLVQR